jgi:hypothetical protein
MPEQTGVILCATMREPESGQGRVGELGFPGSSRHIFVPAQ